MRLGQTAPETRPLRTSAPVEETPPEASAAVHDAPPLLQRHGVRIAGLLATLLALGAVALPMVTGMSAWEWVRSGNARAAYRGENLRFVEAITLARLGLSARALDAAEGLTSPENRNEALQAIFPRLLDPWQPDLAFRAIQLGETGQTNVAQTQRRSEAIQASVRGHGLDSTLERLDRTLSGMARTLALDTLIRQSIRYSYTDALRIIKRMPASEARDTLLLQTVLPQMPADVAITQSALFRSHARRMEFLSQQGAYFTDTDLFATDPYRLAAAEKALKTLRALETPADRRYVAASSQRLIGIYLAQNQTDRAQALLERAGAERDILLLEMARHAALRGDRAAAQRWRARIRAPRTHRASEAIPGATK